MIYISLRNLQDVERIDLSNYTGSDVNITSFRLVDPDTPIAREYQKDWKPIPNSQGLLGRGRAHPLFVSRLLIAVGN